MKSSKVEKSSTKVGRIPRDVIPPNFTEIRKPNPIIKTEVNANSKKPKKVKDYLKLFEDHPEWPTEEELEVNKEKNKKF